MPHILADDTDVLVKVGVFIVVLVIWGIGALSKMVKNTSSQQKERLRRRARIDRASPTRTDAAGTGSATRAQSPASPARGAGAGDRDAPFPSSRPARVPIPRKQSSRPASNYNAMARPTGNRASDRRCRDRFHPRLRLLSAGGEETN